MWRKKISFWDNAQLGFDVNDTNQRIAAESELISCLKFKFSWKASRDSFIIIKLFWIVHNSLATVSG